MSLERVLYRQLLRLARTHDRHPCLKATLEHPRVCWKIEQLASATAMRPPLPAEGGSSVTALTSSGVPVRIVRPSGGGGGLILSGSLSELTARRGGPQSLAKLIGRIVAQELKEHGQKKEAGEEGAEEEEGDEEDELVSALLSSKSDAQLAAEDDAGWSATVSPAIARWMTDFFRGADHYLPEASLSDIVKREFRRPIEPATGSAASTTAAAAAAAAAASPAKPAHAAASSSKSSKKSDKAHAAPDPRTQLTTDAFGVLRVLNKNEHEGAAKHLRFSEQHVQPDPAFQPPDDAPLPPDGISLEQLRMRPLPRTALRKGVFLLAHPEMDAHGGMFSRSVILLYRHSAHEGAAGVVVNFPFRSSPSTVGERLKRMRLTDPMRILKPCKLHDGGPVLREHVDGGIRTAAMNQFAGMRFLHRHPLLAPLSEQVIGGPLPVWYLSNERVAEAADLMSKMQAANELQIAAAAAAAAGAPASDASSASSSPSSSSVFPSVPRGSFFLPSDLIAYSGNAEWYPGQLESELRRGSWMLAEGNAAHVFTGETGSADIDAAFAAAKKRKNNAKAAANMALANGADVDAVAADSSSSSGRTSDEQKDSTPASSSSSAAVAAAAGTSASPVRLFRPFTLERLWSHGMHAHGGECRHWAYWPPPHSADDAASPEDRQAMLNELLRGRE